MQIPAVWLIAAAAIAVFGLRPRAAGAAAWGLAGGALALSLFGPVLDVPQWVLDISPYEHVPKLPGGTVEALPLVVMTVLAVAVTAIGFVGLRRRDIG